MKRFLGEGKVADRFVHKEKFDFQAPKDVVHAVTIPPLPGEKIESKKAEDGMNTGILKLKNDQLKVTDLRQKMAEMDKDKEQPDILQGSFEDKEKSEESYINSELHRKITRIK